MGALVCASYLAPLAGLLDVPCRLSHFQCSSRPSPLRSEPRTSVGANKRSQEPNGVMFSFYHWAASAGRG